MSVNWAALEAFSDSRNQGGSFVQYEIHRESGGWVAKAYLWNHAAQRWGPTITTEPQDNIEEAVITLADKVRM